MFLCPDSVRIYAKEFQGHDSLGIAIFDSATSMGEYAFDQCAIIRTLYCSLLTIIPKFGVSHCPYLRDIDFNNVVEIKDHAFTQSGIQECYFPSATTLGHCVFESCTNLNIAYLPKVTTMGDNVFKGCNQLKWLLLPNIISDKERIRLGIPDKTHVVSDISKIPKLPNPILKKLFSRGPHIADALICLARKRFVLPKNTHQSLQNTLSQLNKNDFPAISKLINKHRLPSQTWTQALYSWLSETLKQSYTKCFQSQVPKSKEYYANMGKALSIVALHTHPSTHTAPNQTPWFNDIETLLLKKTRLSQKEWHIIKTFSYGSFARKVQAIARCAHHSSQPPRLHTKTQPSKD